MVSGGNKTLPSRGLFTLGKVWKVPLITNTTIHKHHHHGGRSPLLRRGIYGSARSKAGNLFAGDCARALGCGFV